VLNEALYHEGKWGSGGIPPPFLTFSLAIGEWLASGPNGFTCGEIVPSTSWVEDWVDPRASLDPVEDEEISCTYWELNHDTSVIHSIAMLVYWLSHHAKTSTFRALLIDKNWKSDWRYSCNFLVNVWRNATKTEVKVWFSLIWLHKNKSGKGCVKRQ
jgi:hypothetical protein